jgi:hypothetical protein
MDRPLWQIILTMLLAAVALHRLVAGALLYADASVLLAASALQGVAAAVAAVGMWRGRHWVVGALIVLGVTVVATAVLAAFFLGIVPPLAAISQGLVAALAAGALAVIAHLEFREGGVPRESADPR